MRRLASWRLSWAIDAKKTLDDLAATGFEPSDDRDRVARIAEQEQARGTKQLPNDRDLFAALGLSAYYARVYRFGSDTVHYSMGSALRGFLEYPDKVVGDGRISLKFPRSDESEEALALAAVVYGEFLERCELVIQHGVTEVVREAFVAYWNARPGVEDAPEQEAE